ncbi:MAG: haloacid dehalogenase [Armatimonadota bacterium]|nr:MAG: haloacid dehalogenase [Armatimonadota bacterium]
MNLKRLTQICDKIRSDFDAKDAAREKALALSREVIRNSANAIRGVHRGELGEARKLIAASSRMLAQVNKALKGHPDIHYAGFAQDAQKEHAEACITLALVHREQIPDPDELKVDYPAYLLGLSEAVGELRRHVLDEMRGAEPSWGEELLTAMDDIYYLLVSFDYPSAVSGNLKRATDVTRSIIEKTRGDVTNALRQERLERAMRRLEKDIGAGDQ